MDPASIAAMMTLVVTLVELGKQIAEKIPRARKRYDELAAFLIVLNYEGRGPTAEEFIRFTAPALEAAEGVQGALQRLRDVKTAHDAAQASIAANPEPEPPSPEEE